jgi:hypothetical protein
MRLLRKLRDSARWIEYESNLMVLATFLAKGVDLELSGA